MKVIQNAVKVGYENEQSGRLMELEPEARNRSERENSEADAPKD